MNIIIYKAKKFHCKALKEAGFTLVEVLVAVLVLSIGILGMIALESKVMRDNQSAYYRSQATILIYDMIDTMRANRSVDYASIIPSSAASDCVTYSDDLPAGNCSNKTEVAKKHYSDWKNQASLILPLGDGAISLSSSVYTVTVTWDDNRDGDTIDAEESFSMSFEL